MSMCVNPTFACFSGCQIGMLFRQRLCLQWGLSPRHLSRCLFSDQVRSQCPVWKPSPFSSVYLPSRIHRKSTTCMQSLWVFSFLKHKCHFIFNLLHDISSFLSFSWFSHRPRVDCWMWIKRRLSWLHILQKQKMHQSMCCRQALCTYSKL